MADISQKCGRGVYHCAPRTDPKRDAHDPQHDGICRADSETPWGALSFELRSVNHRYLELNPRLPEELRRIEPALRERVAAKLTRGKVDVNRALPANDAARREIRLQMSDAC